MTKWLGSTPRCDLAYYGAVLDSDHSHDVSEAFVDGATKFGPWALMCPTCHKRYGRGLGTGAGQKYDGRTLEKIEG